MCICLIFGVNVLMIYSLYIYICICIWDCFIYDNFSGYKIKYWVFFKDMYWLFFYKKKIMINYDVMREIIIELFMCNG